MNDSTLDKDLLIEELVDSTNEPTDALEEELQQILLECYGGNITQFASDIANLINSEKKCTTNTCIKQYVKKWADDRLRNR